MLSLLLALAHIALATLILALVVNVTRLARQDARTSHASGELSGTRENSAIDRTAESKAQVHLFWAAQMLDMRLSGFDRNQLAHPAVRKEAVCYLQGVADAIADHYQVAPAVRQKLKDSLLNRYLDQSNLERLTVAGDAAQPPRGESYQCGLEAASHWLQTRRFKRETSLLSAVHQWGFIG